jgi:hypothetical protein
MKINIKKIKKIKKMKSTKVFSDGIHRNIVDKKMRQIVKLMVESIKKGNSSLIKG